MVSGIALWVGTNYILLVLTVCKKIIIQESNCDGLAFDENKNYEGYTIYNIHINSKSKFQVNP